MTRYFYYFILLNMLISQFAYVPNILIGERFEGAVVAILLAPIIGFCFIHLFIRTTSNNPEKGLPEILEGAAPSWVRIPVIAFFGCMIFLGGLISLLAFTNVSVRIINPDISGLAMITMYMIVILFICRFRSESLLYTMEIVLIINVPFILFILFKAYTSSYLSWSIIYDVLMTFKRPSWNSLSTATFVFSGYISLLIFWRVFKGPVKRSLLWCIPIAGLMNMVTSFIIPIGLHGSDSVDDYVYHWVASADSIHIEFGPIERITSLFMILYISISTLSVIIQWHVALQLLRSLSRPKLEVDHPKSLSTWMVLAFFVVCLYAFEFNLNENDMFYFGKIWLDVRLAGELFLVLLLFILARRKRHV